MTTTVVAVLKSGGQYDAGHVMRLAHQVRRHSPRGTPFICLSDLPLGADFCRPLRHDWPSWWSKVEVWAMPGPLLYLDLDVSILGDLSPLLDAAAGHDLIACRNFWMADPHVINSSVMAWRSDAPRRLYDLFVTDPARFMLEGEERERWGDQGFIAHHYSGRIEHWQALLPGMVLSYKRDVMTGADARDCRVCVFHGEPKPWDGMVHPTFTGGTAEATYDVSVLRQ